MCPVFWQPSIWQDRLFQGAYHCHLRHNCLPSGLLLITKRKKGNKSCLKPSRVEQKRILAPVGIASWYSANFQHFFFFLRIHEYYMTWKKAVHSQSKDAFFHLLRVYLLYVSPPLYWAETCVLICKRSRPAYNLFITFRYFNCLMRSKRLTELGNS